MTQVLLILQYILIDKSFSSLKSLSIYEILSSFFYNIGLKVKIIILNII